MEEEILKLLLSVSFKSPATGQVHDRAYTCSCGQTYLAETDVDRSVDKYPGDCLVTSWLSKRSFVSDVITGVWY